MWLVLPLLTLHLAAMPAPQVHLVPRLTLAQAMSPPPLVPSVPSPPPLVPLPPELPPMTAPPLVPFDPPAEMPPPSLFDPAPPRRSARGGHLFAEAALATLGGLTAGALVGAGTLGAFFAATPSQCSRVFCISNQQVAVVLVGALLELVVIPLASAVAVTLFADGLHLTRSIGGAIAGAYLAMVINVAVTLVLPPVILLLPLTVALGATLGANALAPAAEAAPLLSPTARAVVASW